MKRGRGAGWHAMGESGCTECNESFPKSVLCNRSNMCAHREHRSRQDSELWALLAAKRHLMSQ